MAHRQIRLPRLGEGADSGSVVAILVKVGEAVKKNQSLIELENEKAVAARNVLPAGKVHFIWAVFYLLQVPQMVPAVEEHRAIDVIPTALWR